VSLGALDRYAFVNAKLRARIGSMLEMSQWEQLMRSNTLEELLHALRGTGYEPLMEIYDQSGDVQRLEAWLFSRNVELHREVAKYMDGMHSRVVLAFTRKLEVENLKGIIRLWFSNTVKHQNIDHRFGYLFQRPIVEDIDWTRIINADTYDEIVDELGGTPYEEAVSRFDSQHIAGEGLFDLETALDRAWIHLLRQEVKQLPNEDRTLTEEVLDRDADLKNIINLVRFGWMYRLPKDRLRTMMLEGGRLVGTKEFENYLDTTPENRSPEKLVARRFPRLSVELAQMEDTSPEAQTRMVERYLFTARKQSFKTMLQGNPFTIGTILAYFFLEEKQNGMVRTLINGIHYGWKFSDIREYAV